MDNIKSNREALEIVARSSALDLYKLGRVHAEYEIIKAFALSDTCPSEDIKCITNCRMCWENALREARQFRRQEMSNCNECLYDSDGTCQNSDCSFDLEDNCYEFESKATYDRGYQQGMADAINKMIKAEIHKDFCKEVEGPCNVTNNCTECRVKYLKKLKDRNNDRTNNHN